MSQYDYAVFFKDLVVNVKAEHKHQVFENIYKKLNISEKQKHLCHLRYKNVKFDIIMDILSHDDLPEEGVILVE